MQQLLFTVIFVEMALIILLSFKTPLRKLVIMSLDRVKRGRGPVMVKTVAGTVAVVLASSVYSMMTIQKRWIDEGAVNPTDQVLMAKHLLESTLMGSFLFFGLMIDRQHHFIRELRIRRKNMEVAKKQGRGFEDEKVDENKMKEEELNSLSEKYKKLKSELQTKAKEVTAAEASAVAIKKQSEGFLLEHDRLREENNDLRNRLQSLDRRLSRSDSKKKS